MKKLKEIKEIQPKKSPSKPTDIEELKRKLLSDEIDDSEVVALGANRSQYFVRIPARLSRMLELTTKKKMKVSWHAKAGKLLGVKLEVV